MSTGFIEHFRLLTDVGNVFRKDLAMADRTLLQPTNANPLLDGEFVQYDASYRAIRADGSTLAWPVFAEQGRYDTQAIGKVPVLYMGAFEADSRIFGGTPALGARLMLDDTIAIPAGNPKSALVTHGGGTELTMGFVTRTAATNGGKLRFMRTYGF